MAARRTRVVVGALVLGLATAACSGSGWNPGAAHTSQATHAASSRAAPSPAASSPGAPSGATSSPATGGGTATPPAGAVAALSWASCPSSFGGVSKGDQCATLPVPLDRTKPDGQQILLQLVRRPATDPSQRIGSLLINPGGPGESTVGEFDGLVGLLSGTLHSRFDIVGWDPRGVGVSAPVRCVDGATMDRLTASSPDPTTPQGLAQFESDERTYVDGCAQMSGGLLAHVGTIDSAKDMDVIRASLGEDQLSYLGFSYGTELGETYASLYPNRVRAFVLDGALDPKLDPLAVSAGQSAGFEANLEAFFAWCKQQGANCPWKTDDPTAAYGALLAQVQKSPPSVGGRRLTPSLFLAGVLLELYDQSFWEQLALGLNELGHGDARLMLALSDQFFDRDAHGNYSNTYDAFTAISCLDSVWPAGVAPYVNLYQTSEAQDPLVTGGYANAIGPGYSCALWPDKAAQPLPTSVVNAPPILVVGTTNDPATPFSNAVGMQQEITGSFLVERRGNGHTGYSASACVRTFVDNYLVQPTNLPSSRHVVCDP